MQFQRQLHWLVFTILLAGIQGVHAATHLVNVTDAGFSPSALTIEMGDEVVWINGDGEFHTITSHLPPLNVDYWNAVLFDEGDAFGKVFQQVGEFTYSDNFTGRSGSITVTASGSAGIKLAAPRIENGQFLFEISGLTPGYFAVLEASTNLTTWSGISTNLVTTPLVTFTNTAAGPGTFFRVYETPYSSSSGRQNKLQMSR